MSQALALIDDGQYTLMSKLAKIAAMSGYTQNNEMQAMFIMLRGFELGISPMQSLDGIQVIKGKTVVSPQLMLALINRSGQLEDMQMDGDAKSYSVTMTRKGRSPHTETFTMEHAKAMGLAGKDNWNKQPATMLKWRAVSACARVVYPDIIGGMYFPEEMGAEVSEDASGEIVIEQPPLAVLPPPNVDIATGEVVEGELVQDAPKTDLKATPSDLPAETESVVVDTPNAAQAAKSALAGHGAPEPGEQKRMATDKPFSYDRIKLFMEAAKVKALADVVSAERNNTIIAMEGEGAFKDAHDYQQCVELVVARINSPEHGKGKKQPKPKDDPFGAGLAGTVEN